MKFKIQRGDSIKILLIKVLYLAPFVLVVYPLLAMYLGAKELGYPFSGLSGYFSDAYARYKETK